MSHFGRSGPPDISDTYSLLILNISFRTTADDLFPLFDKYGKVVDIFIPKDRRTGDSRGFAFVRYKYADEAQKAVDRLDGREVDGREITVQFAKYGPNAERIHRGRIIEKSPRSRGRSRSRSPSRRSQVIGLEIVLNIITPDTVMIITTTGIIGGEVAAGAGIGTIDTMAGNEAIAIEAGVVAIVQTMTELVAGDAMMTMSDGAGVALLKVVVLEGVCHLVGPLPGVEALIAAVDHQVVVFHQTVAILILGAFHLVVLIRSDRPSHELEFKLISSFAILMLFSDIFPSSFGRTGSLHDFSIISMTGL
ncbi:hypothetical protein OSB04_030818 [Centaurea solstitialis]|uniref:RRM domain-containing protein n=1 Tax=Centaurea solstitialis TaxID=347529 RepID=A0AA38W467_9ASTR|nr:hypothetical protein OSB04_030818 [Centaurea solstitialis]